jgi:hypothetical protein
MSKNHNPAARPKEQVLGTKKPDTVSACSWKRPYTYYVIRIDDGRLSRLDDHEEGRILCEFKTRHNAVGTVAKFERTGGEYIIDCEPNNSYENYEGYQY